MKRVVDRKLERTPFAESSPDEPGAAPGKKIAILIPGIRTNADWIDETSRHVETFSQPIRVIKTIGGRISAWHLISRMGLPRIIQDVQNQISQVLIENPESEVSLICHSMGTDVISEVIDQINYKFEYIIFVGSVCHTKYASRIAKSCSTFVNHRGTYDPWPAIASIVRPDKYRPTGIFGFNKGAFVNDISFNNDHYTCTNNEHISEYVLPVINGARPEYPTNICHAFSLNTFHYWRRSVYVSIFAGGALAIYYNTYMLAIPLFVAIFCLSFFLLKGRAKD